MCDICRSPGGSGSGGLITRSTNLRLCNDAEHLDSYNHVHVSYRKCGDNGAMRTSADLLV